jgi:uncharacterized protein (TIGR02268 family)
VSLLPVHVVSVFILLLGLPVLAQPRPEGAERPMRQLELPPLQGAAEVRVAPGFPTTLLFNARIDRSAVERAGRELGFARVAAGEDTLTVVPGVEAQAGAQLRLPVRFMEGPPQEGEAVVFVVDPLNAEAHVEVSRRVRTVPALEEALAVERARYAAKEAELAARDAQVAELRAAHGGLAGLVEAGILGRDGISVREVEIKLPPGLSAGNGRLYVATGRVALVVELTLVAGARPWAPARATLEPRTGDTSTRLPARVTRLLKAAVLAPGDKALLVVEFEVPTGGPEQMYKLEVLEQGGERSLWCVSLELPAPAASHR